MILAGGVIEFFGLDISFNKIQVVQLRGNGPHKTFWRWGQLEIDPRYALAGEPESVYQLLGAIERLRLGCGITTRNVVVSLPNQIIQNHLFKFDDLSDRDIGKLVDLNIKQRLIPRAQDYTVDWIKLGAVKSVAGSPKVEVLVSAAKKDYVERWLDIIEGSKHNTLNLIAFEPRGLAIARAVSNLSQQSPELIINLEENSTDLIIVHQSKTRLVVATSSSISEAARLLTSQLNVDNQKARQIVVNSGFDQEQLEGRVYQAVRGSFGKILNNVDEASSWFKNRYQQNIAKIILTGPGSQIKNLANHISQELKIKTEIGNSWGNVSYNPAIQRQLLSNSYSFAAAVGLAQRD